MVFWKLWGLFVAILFAELRASQPPYTFPLHQDSGCSRPAEPFPTLEDPCGSPHSYSPVVARRTWSCAGGAAAPGQTCTPGVWGL